MSVPGEESDPSQTEDEPAADDGETNPDLGDAEPAAEPEKPLTRKERRAALDTARETEKQLRQEIAEANKKLGETNASVAEMRGYLQAQAQHQQRGQAEDAVTTKAKGLRSEAERHLFNASQAKSPEVAKAEMDAYHDKLEEASVMKAHAAIMGEIQRVSANAPDPQNAAIVGRIQSEHPWLGTDRVATAATMALENQMIESGKPATYETSRAAATQVAKMMGLGGQSNGGNRGAYSGVPSRESGSGAGGAVPQLNPSNLEKWQRDLAEKAYPKLEAPAAHRAWAAAMTKHFKANPNG
jgi:hypothetical protein